MENHMQIKGKVVLVTGANRGLGQQFVKSLLAAGAAKVYAAARDPGQIKVPGAEAVLIDATKLETIAAAAKQLTDVYVVINNAGAIKTNSLLDPASLDAVRELSEINTVGMLAVTQAFAPILARNGGGAVVNVLSVLSWLTIDGSGPYSASKSAAWAITNGLRTELRGQKTLVVGVHPAFIDTDMTAGIEAPKTSPEEVVRQVLEGIEKGDEEILVDGVGRNVKQSLSSATPAYLTPAH
jgi:NAD(P)-dependent dehydrogenase (short-subunit alcohol dehydrogenase family)